MPPQTPTPTPLQQVSPTPVIPIPPTPPISAPVVARLNLDILRRARGWLWPIVIFCAIGLLVYSVRVAAVTGRSMEPALHEGSRIVIDKLTVRVLGIGRGDVIVFKNPKDASVTEVKRVIGLPGELVLIEGGTISVTPPGGRLMEFPRGTYVGGNGQIGDFRVQLGPQEYFVLGDNRSVSTDSRAFGAVRPADIVGRVIYSF